MFPEQHGFPPSPQHMYNCFPYIQGNGDGTVNYRSLVGCTRWVDQQKQPVTHHEFPGLDHLQVQLIYIAYNIPSFI